MLTFFFSLYAVGGCRCPLQGGGNWEGRKGEVKVKEETFDDVNQNENENIMNNSDL